MIATVLKELGESVQAQLPGCIDRIAAFRADELGDATLVNSFKFLDWWDVQTGKAKLEFPALQIAWPETKTGQRNGTNARRGAHDIIVTYGVRHNDAAYLKRQMLYVPEAILLWLDELPTASRRPGQGLTLLGLDKADDNEIDISHAPEVNEGGFFIWSVDVAFTVLATDQNLPRRSI